MNNPNNITDATDTNDSMATITGLQIALDEVVKMAGKLKQQRDKAMAELDDYKSAFEAERLAANDQMHQRLLAERERDEAIEFSNSRIQLTDNLYLQITGLLDDLEKYKKQNAKLRDVAERAIWRMANGVCLPDASAFRAIKEEGLKLCAELEQIKEGAK